MAFAALLRELAAISGLERIRYTSPHPLFFDDDLIRAHGELEHLCPHVHLPLQSGSDRVLETMGECLVVTRRDGTIARANNAACALADASLAENPLSTLTFKSSSSSPNRWEPGAGVQSDR